MITLTSQQAAALVGLSKQTLLKHARAGEFPAIDLGNRWLFLKEPLEQWLTEKAQAEQSQRKAMKTKTAAPKHSKETKKRKPLIKVG